MIHHAWQTIARLRHQKYRRVNAGKWPVYDIFSPRGRRRIVGLLLKPLDGAEIDWHADARRDKYSKARIAIILDFTLKIISGGSATAVTLLCARTNAASFLSASLHDF